MYSIYNIINIRVYIRRCLILLQCVGEYRRINPKHLNSSWEIGHVNLMISPDLAGDVN